MVQTNNAGGGVQTGPIARGVFSIFIVGGGCFRTISAPKRVKNSEKAQNDPKPKMQGAKYKQALLQGAYIAFV